jgi:hypothetical protein
MRWRRKIERDGTWWAQARDGSWARWDADTNDWSPQLSGPGGVAPLEPETGGLYAPPPDRGPEGSPVWYFVRTWGESAGPGLILFGLVLAILLPITMLWNVFFVPWLTGPIHLGDVLLVLLGATVAATGFLSLAVTVGKFVEPPFGLVLGAAILAGGIVLTLWGVSTATGLSVGELARSREAAMVACVIAAGWLMVAVRRWVRRD